MSTPLSDVAAAAPATIRRADLLALVASVEAVAQRDAMLDREVAARLQQPGQAPTSVDDPGSNDRTGRATVDATAARAAAVVDRSVVDRQRRRREDRAEHEPTPLSGQEQVRALAVPPEAGAVRGLAIDERVVVDEHTRVPAVRPQVVGDRVERGAQRAVVVVVGVRRDAGTAVRRRRWWIRARAHDDGLRVGERASGIGRTFWVAIREAHPAVQSRGAALVQDGGECPGTVRRLRCRRRRARPRVRAPSARRRRSCGSPPPQGRRRRRRGGGFDRLQWHRQRRCRRLADGISREALGDLVAGWPGRCETPGRCRRRPASSARRAEPHSAAGPLGGALARPPEPRLSAPGRRRSTSTSTSTSTLVLSLVLGLELDVVFRSASLVLESSSYSSSFASARRRPTRVRLVAPAPRLLNGSSTSSGSGGGGSRRAAGRQHHRLLRRLAGERRVAARCLLGFGHHARRCGAPRRGNAFRCLARRGTSRGRRRRVFALVAFFARVAGFAALDVFDALGARRVGSRKPNCVANRPRARSPGHLVVLPHGLALAAAQRVLDGDEPHALGELASPPRLVELRTGIGQAALGQVAVHRIPERRARQADALLGHAGGAGGSDDLGLLGENGHREARDPRRVDPGLAGDLARSCGLAGAEPAPRGPTGSSPAASTRPWHRPARPAPQR